MCLEVGCISARVGDRFPLAVPPVRSSPPTMQPLHFVGEFDLTLDAKNRLSLPAAVRGAIDPQRDGDGFYITLGRDGRLCIYTQTRFDLVSSRKRAEAEADPDRHDITWFAYANSVKPDSAGRLQLTEKMLRKGGLTKEVTLVGQDDRLEIWDRAAWEEFELEEDRARKAAAEAANRRRKAAMMGGIPGSATATAEVKAD